MLKYLVLDLVFPLIEPEEQCFWDYAVASYVKVLSMPLVSYLQLRSYDIIGILTGIRMRSLVIQGFILSENRTLAMKLSVLIGFVESDASFVLRTGQYQPEVSVDHKNCNVFHHMNW